MSTQSQAAHYPDSETWILKNLCPLGSDTLLLDGLITAESFYLTENQKAYRESGLCYVQLHPGQHHICLVADAEQRRMLASELTQMVAKLAESTNSIPEVLSEILELYKHHDKQYERIERCLSQNARY